MRATYYRSLQGEGIGGGPRRCSPLRQIPALPGSLDLLQLLGVAERKNYRLARLVAERQLTGTLLT